MSSSKTILITRSHDDGHELHERLHAAGYRAIHEPLTQVVLNHTARLPLAQVLAQEPDAILITSRNGARALATLTEMRDLPLLCVGDATAETAESLGFIRVSTTGRTAEDMAHYVCDAYDYDVKLLHVCGAHSYPLLEEHLRQYGMAPVRIAAYEAVASESLSDTLLAQIEREQIDGVVLMSERTSRIWLSLLEKAQLHAAASRMTAYCISDQAGAPLHSSSWPSIRIADEPILDRLIDTIIKDHA